jgi:hypothetical protein
MKLLNWNQCSASFEIFGGSMSLHLFDSSPEDEWIERERYMNIGMRMLLELRLI